MAPLSQWYAVSTLTLLGRVSGSRIKHKKEYGAFRLDHLCLVCSPSRTRRTSVGGGELPGGAALEPSCVNPLMSERHYWGTQRGALLFSWDATQPGVLLPRRAFRCAHFLNFKTKSRAKGFTTTSVVRPLRRGVRSTRGGKQLHPRT